MQSRLTTPIPRLSFMLQWAPADKMFSHLTFSRRKKIKESRKLQSDAITSSSSWLFPAETGTDGTGICESEPWEGHGTGRLVITFLCSVRSERAPWSPKTWRQNTQTRDCRVCRRSSSSSHPAAKRSSRPGRGHAVSKTSVKYDYGFVRWEGNRRIFAVYRLVSTDCMCGLDLSGCL